MTRTTVVIPNWNGRSYLSNCLDALREQDFSDFDVIVVDNGSTDGSVELIGDNYDWVRLIRFGENRGFVAAVNAGIESSTSEYVALLNNDTRPGPAWLGALVRALDQVPEASFAASKLLLADRDVIDAAGDRYSFWRGTGLSIGAGEAPSGRSVRAWVFGACAAAAIYRRALFEDIGVFDEEFFLLHEDVDIDMRAQLAGHRCLYVPEAVVRHVGGASTDTSDPAAQGRSWRNRLWVAGKSLPWPALLLWGACFAPRFVGAAVFRGRGALPSYVKELSWGLRRLPAKRRETRRPVESAAALRVLLRPPHPLVHG